MSAKAPILIRNGRASFAQIANDVGLSAHAVAERVRRLEARGAIQGYTARINQRRLGRGLAAYVDVRLLPTTDPEKFERLALGLPATQRIAFVTGRFDYIVEPACREDPQTSTRRSPASKPGRRRRHRDAPGHASIPVTPSGAPAAMAPSGLLKRAEPPLEPPP
jgi:hypothetical protein